MTPTDKDDLRHECRRSGDFEKISEHQGYVRRSLETIDDSLKAIFIKLDKPKAANSNKLVYGAITAFIMALSYAAIAMVKG